MISKLPRSTTFETSMILNCTWNWVFQDNNQVRRGILEQFAQCIWKSLLRVTSSYPRINKHKQWCLYAREQKLLSTGYCRIIESYSPSSPLPNCCLLQISWLELGLKGLWILRGSNPILQIFKQLLLPPKESFPHFSHVTERVHPSPWHLSITHPSPCLPS